MSAMNQQTWSFAPLRPSLSAVRRFVLGLSVLLLGMGLNAQVIRDAVTWSRSVEDKSPTEKVLVFTATVKDPWHLYGTELPKGGPRRSDAPPRGRGAGEQSSVSVGSLWRLILCD